ncbi:MAG: hypothetical protein HQM09_16945, partial [Candidatus Riflebacteria bacterium]|nr:hypothetical protein [Candidatus Riflebacteria bacterium]
MNSLAKNMVVVVVCTILMATLVGCRLMGSFDNGDNSTVSVPSLKASLPVTASAKLPGNATFTASVRLPAGE